MLNVDQKMIDELLPCPFCGSKAKFTGYQGNCYLQYRVCCTNEKTCSSYNAGTNPCDELEQASSMWNKRKKTTGDSAK